MIICRDVWKCLILKLMGFWVGMFIHVFEVSIPPMLKYIYISLHLYLHDLLFFIHIWVNWFIHQYALWKFASKLFCIHACFLFVPFSEKHAFNRKSSWMISVFVPSWLGYRKSSGLVDVLRSHRFSSHWRAVFERFFLDFGESFSHLQKWQLYRCFWKSTEIQPLVWLGWMFFDKWPGNSPDNFTIHQIKFQLIDRRFERKLAG